MGAPPFGDCVYVSKASRTSLAGAETSQRTFFRRHFRIPRVISPNSRAKQAGSNSSEIGQSAPDRGRPQTHDAKSTRA